MKFGYHLPNSVQPSPGLPNISLIAKHLTAPRFNALGGFFILKP